MSKKAKNYIILAAIFALGVVATLYLCRWYKVYDEYQKQTPVIRDTLSEITIEELDTFVLENPTITIYMCTSSDTVCRNYEKELKKLVVKKNLTSAIVYLNLSDIESEDFVNEFNNKYQSRYTLTDSYPAFVTFEDGEVKYILQGSAENKLTISKTKQYMELNKIGE